MASAAAMCHRSVLRTQTQQEMASSGKRCLSLDTWACQTTTTTTVTSTTSSSGSSCTTEKGAKSLALNTSEDEQEASSREPQRCETPKSKKHRIPVVDVDLCPPAPKKPRGSGRMAQGSNLMHKLGFSPGYLF